MTSKEILERLVGALLGDNNYYKQYVASTPIILQDKEVIEKDLKVLEIIKNIVSIEDLSEKGVKDGEFYILKGGIIKTKTEFNLIKEWLER